MVKLKARKGICAVVFRKRGKKTEFLLLHRVLHWKGWEFPKGGRKENETCEQAFFRELKEELGVSKKQLLKFKKLAFFQEFEDFVRLRHHKNRAFVAELSPKAKILLSKNPDAEHSSFRWVSKEKFLRMIDFQDSKLVFRKALRFY